MGCWTKALAADNDYSNYRTTINSSETYNNWSKDGGKKLFLFLRSHRDVWYARNLLTLYAILHINMGA